MTPSTEKTEPRIGLRKKDVVKLTGLSGTTIEEAKASGALRFKKFRGAVIFLPRDVERFLENLPDGKARKAGKGQW